MSKFERLKIGTIGLVQETEDGRIRQIALTTDQSTMLQSMLAVLSSRSPLIQMGEEYDLVLKRNVNQSKL